MLTPTYIIRPLSPQTEIETVPVLKALVEANKALAELKGRAATIPNQGILIDTLALQEAKASSEIENIVTTQDELFQADLFPEGPDSVAAKEVPLYRDALHLGFQQLKETDGLILNKGLIAIFQRLKKREDGFRNTPGTALKNERTGEVVFVPPQDGREIIGHMSDLERFLNDDGLCDLERPWSVTCPAWGHSPSLKEKPDPERGNYNAINRWENGYGRPLHETFLAEQGLVPLYQAVQGPDILRAF